ncbi:hypothetical protein E8E12_011281 [Didymella heteroderae]|uniref:BZIP domain-containing protein n=1 Tax=Didymella heteroderae TaxID=1769908 RepID=A0A9P4X2J0_9PLEO|nr:hypothetical protein E8E12_011281 [Didymella heteroderae]
MRSDSTSSSSSKDVDKSSAAYLKRREQVRRAQRTHRERKETYIHTLESEVLALRTKARNVEEQNDELSEKIKGLERRLDRQKAGSKVWDTKRETRNGHVDMAMEFVLTLEKPCIMLAQSAVFDPLNAYPSNPLLDRNELALYHSFVEDKLLKPGSCTQENVARSLNNLLSLSSAFNLDHEVTPIQAWQHLRGYFELGAVDINGFRLLADMLLQHVRCYGYTEEYPRCNL